MIGAFLLALNYMYLLNSCEGFLADVLIMHMNIHPSGDSGIPESPLDAGPVRKAMGTLRASTDRSRLHFRTGVVVLIFISFVFPAAADRRRHVVMGCFVSLYSLHCIRISAYGLERTILWYSRSIWCGRATLVSLSCYLFRLNSER